MYKLKIARKGAPAMVQHFKTLQEVAACVRGALGVDSFFEAVQRQKVLQIRIFLKYQG